MDYWSLRLILPFWLFLFHARTLQQKQQQKHLFSVFLSHSMEYGVRCAFHAINKLLYIKNQNLQQFSVLGMKNTEREEEKRVEENAVFNSQSVFSDV